MRSSTSPIWLSLFLFVVPSAWADDSGIVPPAFNNVQEEDASPSCFGSIIKVSNTTLTDNADGTCSVTTGGGGGNSFETIAVPAGTDPVADSSTDTLTITETAGFDVTGVVADTLNFAVDLTEVSTLTLGAGAFTTLTFDAGATDPVLTAASNSLNLSTGRLGLGQSTPVAQLDILVNAGANIESFNIQHNDVDDTGLDLNGATTTGNFVDISTIDLTTGRMLLIGGNYSAWTTGNLVEIQVASPTVTTGEVFHAEFNETSAIFANKSGNTHVLSTSRNDTGTASRTDDFDNVLMNRTTVKNNATGTLTNTGSVLRVETTTLQTAGTLTSTVDGIQISVQSPNVGDALDISHSSGGDSHGIDLNSETVSGNAMRITGTELTTGDALQITVDNSMTTGRAIRILGGAAGATEVFNIDEDGNVNMVTDALLTMGSDTFEFDGTTNDFELSDDLSLTDATPHLQLIDSTANEDDFEWYANANEVYLQNVTDATTLFRFDASNNLILRGGSRLYAWPTADGTNGQVLSTNASGVLSWATASGSGDSVTVNTTAIDTTANLKDTATVTWAVVDGGAGGPDDAEATAVDVTCTDCIGATEIADIYLLNSGDTGAGDYIIYRDSLGTTSAGLTIEEDGTGDATLVWTLTGVDSWAAGIDNSHADNAFIFANSNALLGSSNAVWSAFPSGDAVTFGTSVDLGGKVNLDGIADEIQWLVQANATQTTSLVTFETSSGTDLFTFSNAGDAVFGGDLDLEDDTPHLRLTDTTASEDDFELYADGNQLYITNVTDSLTYLNVTPVHAITLGNASVPSITLTTNSTGDGEIVLPDASIGATELGTDSVSADELNATGVEAELEAALDIGGEVTSTGMASTVIADTVTVTGWVLGTSSATTFTAGTVNIDLLDGVGAVDMDYGSADITDHTFTTDGTGTAEIVLPAGSIDGTEILNGTIALADTAITAGRSLTIATDDIAADAELFTDTKCAWWENPVATDDFKSIWFAKQAATLTSIWAESDQTVTFMLQVDDGTPSDADTVDLAPAAGTAEDTSLDGDATLASGDRLDMAVTSVASTPTWVSVCWTFTYDD